MCPVSHWIVVLSDAVLPTATATVCPAMRCAVCLALCLAVCVLQRALQCVLHCVVFQFVLQHGSAGEIIIMMIPHCNGIWQCVAVCYSVVPRVAVCCLQPLHHVPCAVAAPTRPLASRCLPPPEYTSATAECPLLAAA